MKIAGLVLAVALATCSRAPADVTADDDCAAACGQWRALGCDEGQPTAKGRTCEDVCGAGLAVSISPRSTCVVRAASCADARGCWR